MGILSWFKNKQKPVEEPKKPEVGIDKNLQEKEKIIQAVKNNAQKKLTRIATEMKTKHTADEVYFKKTIKEIHAVADSIAENTGRITN